MPGRASDLIVIPGSFWQRAEVTAALERRDVGRLFHLLRQYAGASQTQLGIACGMTQPKISDIMRGAQKVLTLALFERIADGLEMPDPARITLGLAPSTTPRSTMRQVNAIPSGDARPALDASPFSDLLSIDLRAC